MIYASCRRTDSPFPVGPMGPFKTYLHANAWLRRELTAVPTAELGCIHEQGQTPRITVLAREDALKHRSPPCPTGSTGSRSTPATSGRRS